MIIFEKTGKILLDIPVDDTSYRYRAIRQGDKVNLVFSLTEHVEIPVYSYVDYQGQRYTLWRPEDLTKHGTRNLEYSSHLWRLLGTAKSILKKSANDWLGTNHELSKSGDSIKRKHVHELKRIFQILLDHQGLKVLGTVNVIVDEVCGEGTWIKYSERSERWRKGEEERERIKLERLRKEEEARYKDFDEKLEEWKSGEINFLNTPFYIPGEKPNAWIRIKGNIIETSKQIKIGIAEARKLWRAVSAMHRGAEFWHGLVEDITGHQWSLNRYENDLLTAGCHRIAYNEMERIAKQLGWV